MRSRPATAGSNRPEVSSSVEGWRFEPPGRPGRQLSTRSVRQPIRGPTIPSRPFRAARANQLKSNELGPVVAVDLGFAANAKSCGLAWHPAGESHAAVAVTFDDAVEKTAKLLATDPSQQPTLILEAPLSCFFEDGNPVGRPFEKPRPGSRNPRYWYVGAGGVTCLAAGFFLSRLASRLPAVFPSVLLYEGFVTFKRKGTPHTEDALFLLGEFEAQRVQDVLTPPRIDSISILGLLRLGSPAELPAILGSAPRTRGPEAASSNLAGPGIS